MFRLELLSRFEFYSLNRERKLHLGFRILFVIIKNFVKSRFIISRFCPIQFTVTWEGLKNSRRYIEGFVNRKFVKSRFHGIYTCNKNDDVDITITMVTMTVMMTISSDFSCFAKYGSLCKYSSHILSTVSTMLMQ